MKIYNILDNTITVHDTGITWAGNTANDIRSIVDKNLRDQGISVNSHGVTFYNKSVCTLLDATVKACNNILNEEVSKLLNVA